MALKKSPVNPSVDVDVVDPIAKIGMNDPYAYNKPTLPLANERGTRLDPNQLVPPSSDPDAPKYNPNL
jgi:hypothetical protein